MGTVHRGDRGGQGQAAGRVVLDTDAFSHLYENRPQAESFRPLVGTAVTLSFATVAELLFGAAKGGWGDERIRRLERSLRDVPIIYPDEDLVRVWAELRARAWQQGHPLGGRANANDLWIAASAARHGLPLVTGNSRHFDGLPGVSVRSPEPIR